MAAPLFSSSKPNNGNDFEQLCDFLVNLNQINKEHLRSLPKNCGDFKTSEITEYIFQIIENLRLDPQIGYHAVELLQSFMVKHLTECLSASPPLSNEEEILQELIAMKFPLIVFSCIQLASKLSLYSQQIDLDIAVQSLHLLGYIVTKREVTDVELMVLKKLDFRLEVPNPLTYVETLLEVLRYNYPHISAELLYPQCLNALLIITLNREAFYESLLITSLQPSSSSGSPSQKQRQEFLTVHEDCMLLGVGVIAVSTYIQCFRKWKKVVHELSLMTGITERSITDFTLVTVNLILNLLPTST